MPKKKKILSATIHGDKKSVVINFDDGSTIEIKDDIQLIPRDKKLVEQELAEVAGLQELAPTVFAHLQVNTHEHKINPHYQNFIAEFHKTDDVEKTAKKILNDMGQ